MGRILMDEQLRPGEGKTYFAMRLAAACTNRKPLPGMETLEPFNIIYQTDVYKRQPKYLIFFKGRDADALTAAFTEYTSKKVKKACLLYTSRCV